MGHKFPQMPPCRTCGVLPKAGYDPELCACYRYEQYGTATSLTEFEATRDRELDQAASNVLTGLVFVGGIVAGFMANEVMQWIGLLP